ncbi:MAG: HAMP domain-containing histidine kinase [Acidimicrobiia bacterium]|nr:HAMP domain-containing histidine kinase [Acidimicrobiia bacterium]MDH5521953.1 HAMP domain-containing histidine kinase [Acidimicrobiia bacterium]
MRSLSLQARLLVGVVVVAIVLLVVSGLVTRTTRNHLVGQIDEQLFDAADYGRSVDFPDGIDDGDGDLDGVAAEGRGDGHNESRLEPERISPLFEGRYTTGGGLIAILEPNLPGRTYSPPKIDGTPVVGRPFTVDAEEYDFHYRVIATADPSGDGWRIQALSMSDVDDVVRRMVSYQAVGLITVLLLLAAVAWWVNRLGIRPIKLMTATASEIAEGDLSVRIPTDSVAGSEAGRLANALNTMMSRIQAAATAQERSEQRLRRFMADASHELRTPITTVRGYAELYRHGGLEERSELDDAMRRTEQESQRMERLVQDMMTLANLDQRRDIELGEVDVSSIVEDAGKDASAMAPDRSVIVDVDPGLRVVGDEDRLRQVLANVVANALSHTPADSPLSLGARATDDGAVIIEVADSGPGMAPDVVDNVTERFYRADPSRSRASGGSGLGLAIVKAVVDAHGGDLSIRSDVVTGTTVGITLPRSAR